jgi:hypothetical protein
VGWRSQQWYIGGVWDAGLAIDIWLGYPRGLQLGEAIDTSSWFHTFFGGEEMRRRVWRGITTHLGIKCGMEGSKYCMRRKEERLRL